MEPTLLISILGLLVFGTVMFLGFRYANGNWKVSENKKTDYQNWTEKNGKRVKKAIIIISIIYLTLMLLQLQS